MTTKVSDLFLWDPADLDFDEAEHRYTLRASGLELPSVTTILKAVNIINFDNVPAAPLERKRTIGSYVHEAIHMYQAGDLDPDSIGEVLSPYFDAYLEFKDAFKHEILCSEQRVWNNNLGYAGTIDQIVRTPEDEIIVVDFKTSAVRPWVGLQLAGYRLCLDGVWVSEMAVELKKTGKFKIHSFEDFRNTRAFMGAVEINNWMKLNGSAR